MYIVSTTERFIDSQAYVLGEVCFPLTSTPSELHERVSLSDSSNDS